MNSSAEEPDLVGNNTFYYVQITWICIGSVWAGFFYTLIDDYNFSHKLLIYGEKVLLKMPIFEKRPPDNGPPGLPPPPSHLMVKAVK